MHQSAARSGRVAGDALRLPPSGPFAAPGGEVAGRFAWSPDLSVTGALVRYGRFYLASSLIFDLFRAGANAVLIFVFGPPILTTLGRYRRTLRWQEFPVQLP